jgi:bud site selection protein 31
MSLRRKLKGKKPPEGWELIEEVIEDFEQQLKEAVNEEHEGKRKTELTWKIHRLHWEKNRFIYDLMYQRKVMSKELVSSWIINVVPWGKVLYRVKRACSRIL